MSLRTVLLLVGLPLVPACLPDEHDPPEAQVTIISSRQNLVATTSNAGRFLAFTDENGTIHASLLGKRDFVLADNEIPLAVASDGTDHILLVNDYDGTFMARRVSDASLHPIATGPRLAPYTASLTVTTTGYLASWTMDGTGFVASLASSGDRVGGPWQVTAAGEVDRDLRIAVDSMGAAIVWTHTHEHTSPTTGTGLVFDLHARRLGFDGTLHADAVIGQAIDAAIAGGDAGFVLTSIDMDEDVIARELDANLAPAGDPLTIAKRAELGTGHAVAIAGQPGAFAVQYTSESGATNGVSGVGRSRARVVDGTNVGAAVDLGVYVEPVLTGFGGVFQSAWVQHRTVTTGPDSYDAFDDLFQAELRIDGGTTVEIP